MGLSIPARNTQAAPRTGGGGDWYELHTGGPHRGVRPPPPRPKKTAWQKFKEFFRAFVAFVFSKVGICVLVVCYLLLGAFAFQAIEAPAEAEIVYEMGKFRDKIGSFRPRMKNPRSDLVPFLSETILGLLKTQI